MCWWIVWYSDFAYSKIKRYCREIKKDVEKWYFCYIKLIEWKWICAWNIVIQLRWRLNSVFLRRKMYKSTSTEQKTESAKYLLNSIFNKYFRSFLWQRFFYYIKLIEWEWFCVLKPARFNRYISCMLYKEKRVGVTPTLFPLCL